MEDIKFWATLWLIAACVFTAVAICITSYSLYRTNKMVEMVSNGASPIAASCALAFSDYNNSICVIEAQKK